MSESEIIKEVEAFVLKSMEGYDSGHDWWHIERVRQLASFINKNENLADPFTLEIAALLHDSADSKFAGDDPESAYLRIDQFMENMNLGQIKAQVISAIRNVSFSNKSPLRGLKDSLLMVLQDADRLDAMGAIGIARAFNYGGFRNNIIYNPGMDRSDPSTINHFYAKLLVLKDKMNTETGKRVAVDRHEFMETFLKQFYSEWEFGK
jgi:uncharacterized protein